MFLENLYEIKCLLDEKHLIKNYPRKNIGGQES